ncbi:MAG: sigma-70 family RNA polymerase sigma factor [Clostridia bacterium]|nr:sigma-70 family RNA polymerase sigma factor [Clostridia bacterium]
MEKYNEYFDSIYRSYYGKILRYFVWQIRENKDIADDLTQQTFLKLWQYILKSNCEIKNVKGLIYTIAKNVRADYYRGIYIIEIPIEKCMSLAKTTDYDDSENIVYTALSKLNHVDSQIIKLRLTGFRYEEISTITGINISTLRTRYLTAKRRLKKIIEGM